MSKKNCVVWVDPEVRKEIEDLIALVKKRSGIKLSIKSIVNASLNLYLPELRKRFMTL